MTIQDDQAGSTPAESNKPDDEERLPTVSEQVALQLGGWQGLVESAIPVLVFVVANVLWSLRVAAISAVAFALAMAAVRLAQKRSIRHAMNGLFGVGLGAVLALRTGESRDFYLPGILYGWAYSAVLAGSIVIKRPLVGWLWSIIADKGSQRWRSNPRLMRTFSWLTALWAIVWFLKVGVQALLYVAKEETALGVARLVLGYPPYLLLLAITLWVVRRVMRETPNPA